MPNSCLHYRLRQIVCSLHGCCSSCDNVAAGNIVWSNHRYYSALVCRPSQKGQATVLAWRQEPPHDTYKKGHVPPPQPLTSQHETTLTDDLSHADNSVFNCDL